MSNSIWPKISIPNNLLFARLADQPKAFLEIDPSDIPFGEIYCDEDMGGEDQFIIEDDIDFEDLNDWEEDLWEQECVRHELFD